MTMKEPRITATTADGRTVTLRTRNVGESFGIVGQVVAGNGRVLAETETKPYGFTASALDAARTLAERVGH
jgi:hypothetical protein